MLLAFDHPDRVQAGHAAGQPGLLANGDHLVDVLVGGRGLLGQARVGAGADLDPGLCQLGAERLWTSRSVNRS